MPRQKTEELPADVREVVEALRKVAGREGVTRTKLSSAPVLLALVAKRHPEATVAEKARDAEDLIRTHVNAMPNLRDRALLIAGLNIDGQGDPKSYEERIENIRDDVPGGFSTAAEGDGVIGRFRSQLLIELAWRLLGGAATFATPRPPSSDLELVSRLRSQHQDHDAILVLERVANEAEASRDRRDAWRLLATMRYEGGDYVGADLAFGIAMQFREGARRGGKLAMALDRYAKVLTDDEEYDRALAILKQALGFYIEGRWLWRRYGCVKWYAGDLVDAYAALTHALDLGYPASRVFHARGQVLAELGQYERAIEELEEVLRIPRSVLSQARARSARAFAVGMAGDLQAALANFRLTERVIPDSGWLHYWRALCLLEHGFVAEAVVGLDRALQAKSAALNRPKRERARELLEALAAT